MGNRTPLCIPYHEKVGILLRKAYRHVADVIERHLEPEALTLREYSVLCICGSKNRVPVPIISKMMSLSRDETDNLLCILYSRDLLHRRSGPVTLTQKGRETLARATQHVLAAHKELEQGFSEHEWRLGLDFLMSLAHAAAEDTRAA